MIIFDEFKLYLEEQDYSPFTIRGYLMDLPSFATWFEQINDEVFAPEAVTPIDVREYRQYLLQKKKFSGNTVNRHLAALSKYFRFLLDQEEIERDPTHRIKNVGIPSPTPRWLDKKEQFALTRAMEKDLQFARLRYPKRWVIRQRNFSMVSLMQHTGLRVSEGTHLELVDIAFSERKGILLVRKGKGNKQRSIPLNVDARKALSSWLEIRPKIPGNDFVFIASGSEAQGALSSRTAQRIVQRYGKEAQLLNLTPHVLRHTFAKNLLNSGVTLEKVASLLGHRSLDTTRIYVTPSLQDLEQAVSRIESE